MASSSEETQIAKHIIAIGGGKISGLAPSGIRKYLYDLATSKSGTSDYKPKVTLVPQARLGAPDFEKFIAEFKAAFEQDGFTVAIIRMHDRVDIDGIHETLLSSDIIYVGGGNTFNLMALWKAWGIDLMLKEAYEKGIIMAGTSAGANCWFEHCITDSRKEWTTMDNCLGFLAGTCCPHFDSEDERKPFYLKAISEGSVKAPYIAINDYTAAHYVDGKLFSGLVWKTHLNKYPDEDASLFEISGDGELKAIKCRRIAG